MRRFPMGWVVFAITVLVWVLAMIGIVSIWIALGATVLAALIGAMFLDWTTKGSGAAVRDKDAANFSAP